MIGKTLGLLPNHEFLSLKGHGRGVSGPQPGNWNVMALMLPLILAMLALSPAYSAETVTERRVEVPLTVRWSPVVVTKVTLGDTIVQAGRMLRGVMADPVTPFQAGDDWIQNLTLHLYNRTNKSIVYAELHLVFQEAREVRPDLAGIVPLRLGRIPRTDAGTPRQQLPGPQQISFSPGHTMVVRLSDHIVQIRVLLQRIMPLATATKLKVVLDHIYFADGMHSLRDTYRIADTPKPGKEQRMEPNYFPGDMNLSWPGRSDWNLVAKQDARQVKDCAESPSETDSPSAPVPMQLIFSVFDSAARRSSQLAYVDPTGLHPGMALPYPSGEFSPDGQFIAFDSCGYYPRFRGIYVVRLSDWTSRSILPVQGPFCIDVRWTPDGERLSFTGSADYKLHIVDIATGHEIILPNAPIINWSWWNPKGDKLVFGRGRGGSRELFITDLQGHERQITFFKDFSNTETWAPAWSPDGSCIAFTSGDYLYTIKPDGTDIRRLETQGRVYSPRWSTDSEWIFFKDGDWLMRIRRNGTDLAHVGEFNSPGSFSLGPKWAKAK